MSFIKQMVTPDFRDTFHLTRLLSSHHWSLSIVSDTSGKEAAVPLPKVELWNETDVFGLCWFHTVSQYHSEFYSCKLMISPQFTDTGILSRTVPPDTLNNSAGFSYCTCCFTNSLDCFKLLDETHILSDLKWVQSQNKLWRLFWVKSKRLHGPKP